MDPANHPPVAPSPGVPPAAEAPATPSRFAAIVRTVLHLLVFFVLFFMCVIAVGLLAFILPSQLLISSIAIFAGSLIATAVALRIFHQQPLLSVGLHWDTAAMRHLAWGLALGAGFGAAVTLLPVAMGKATWVPAESAFAWESLILFLVMILFAAIGEEVLFRGFPLQRLMETLGVWPGVVLTSALFAWSHGGNFSVGWLALLNTFLWGLVFAVGYLRSRDLWLPIGLHVGWNWILPLLGVELSGFTLGVVGYRLQGSDPLWDGGDYGPEAGILTTIAVPLILLILWRGIRTRTSHQVETPDAVAASE